MSPSIALKWPFVWPKPQVFCMRQIDIRMKQQGIASWAYCHNRHTWATLVQHNQYLWDTDSCRSDMPISMTLASVVDQQTMPWLFLSSRILSDPVSLSVLLFLCISHLLTGKIIFRGMFAHGLKAWPLRARHVWGAMKQCTYLKGLSGKVTDSLNPPTPSHLRPFLTH